MHIRCERCATLYELDETLLAPEGSPVECAKCNHVFTASPPRAEPRPEPRVEPRPELRAEARVEAPAPEPVRDAPEPSPAPNGAAAPAGGARTLADWDSAPRVYRGSPPVGLRAPVLRCDPVGAFEARLRWMARARWLVPTVAIALLAVAGGALWLVRGRMHPAAERARTEGLALVALDDVESLDQALARFDDALRRSPRLRAVAADRALALVLRATAPAEGDDHSRAFLRSAQEALGKLERELGDDVAVQRARAVHDALTGESERAMKRVAAVRARGAEDSWIDLAEAAASARPDRERVLAELAAAHPELLRARFLLARALVAGGRRGEARTAVDALLAANPRHDGARRLHDALSNVSPATAGPDAPAPSAGPAGNEEASPRKSVALHAAPAGSTSPAPGHPTAGDVAGPGGDGASGAAQGTPLPGPSASATPRRSRAAGALAPAALPELAPASAAPEVEPPSLDAASPEPHTDSSQHDRETFGGG